MFTCLGPPYHQYKSEWFSILITEPTHLSPFCIFAVPPGEKSPCLAHAHDAMPLMSYFGSRDFPESLAAR